RRCREGSSSNRRCPMGRIVLVFALAILGLAPLAGSAAAGCLVCFDQVTLQMPDRLAWSSGKPVTVVVSTHGAAEGAQLPASGVGVAMQRGGDHTECLEKPNGRMKTTTPITGSSADSTTPRGKTRTSSAHIS